MIVVSFTVTRQLPWMASPKSGIVEMSMLVPSKVDSAVFVGRLADPTMTRPRDGCRLVPA